MIRPAGDSSDEDEFKDYYSDDEVSHFKNQVQTEIDIQAQITNDLYKAILNGNLDAVKTILDQGFEVNSVLRDGWTPLLLAASVGNPDITRQLIKRNADVNCNRELLTPLMAACSCPPSTSPYEKSADVANQLIEAGVDVNAATRKRMTALMYAASNGNVEIVAMLLPICDKHAEDNQGWTALFWAVSDNRPEVLQLLLEVGLQAEKFDVRGNTPTHYATMNEFEEIISILPSKKKDKQSYGLCNSTYNVEELFASELPQFLNDVSVMLYGMKSEQHTKLLLNNGVDLLSFLSLTDADLLNMGIKAPYQRFRILSGLYKFHKRMYKLKSIPVVPKDTPYSTFDILCSITTACRQLIAMEASLNYVLKNTTNLEELKEFRKEIDQVKLKLENVKKTAVALCIRSRQLDIQCEPADLITSATFRNKKRNTFRKYVALGTLSLLTFIVIRKYYFK